MGKKRKNSNYRTKNWIDNDKKTKLEQEKKKKHTMDQILQEKKIDAELDEAFELSNSASFMDCTGSVPVAAVTEEQWENYDESYHFRPVPAKPLKKL